MRALSASASPKVSRDTPDVWRRFCSHFTWLTIASKTWLDEMAVQPQPLYMARDKCVLYAVWCGAARVCTKMNLFNIMANMNAVQSTRFGTSEEKKKKKRSSKIQFCITCNFARFSILAPSLSRRVQRQFTWMRFIPAQLRAVWRAGYRRKLVGGNALVRRKTIEFRANIPWKNFPHLPIWWEKHSGNCYLQFRLQPI